MSTLKNGRPTSAAFDRDRIAALTGVILVVAAGWIYLLRGTGVEMAQMDMGDEIAMMTDWTPAYTALTFVMWATMMTVMMLPSAHPALDRIVSYDCDRSPQASSILAALSFAIGYFVVWISIGLAATILQRAFASQGMLSETMAIRSNNVAALLVIAIRLCQFAPLKQACLQRCRARVAGGAGDRVQNAGATMPQGVRYGIYCAGIG